jgi:hypothetical protein
MAKALTPQWACARSSSCANSRARLQSQARLPLTHTGQSLLHACRSGWMRTMPVDNCLIWTL